MKRSEMVQKLHEIINSKLYQDYQFTDEELSDLLDEIEKAGMQPPSVKMCDLMKNGTVDDATNYRRINVWESEE